MNKPPVEGDRVRVTGLTDDPAPLPVGLEGVVWHVFQHADWFQVAVDWDPESGVSRQLMLLNGDPYEVVSRSNNVIQ